MQQIRKMRKQKKSSETKLFCICKINLVRHIDLSWNTLGPSLLLMYRKLSDLGWVYYNGEIHITEPETEKSYFHEAR
jgi:hypothetical protein